MPLAGFRVRRDLGCHMESHTRAGEVGERLGQEVRGDSPVDEQRLGRVADAGPMGLGVEGDGQSLVEVGGPVDVDVADPTPVSMTGRSTRERRSG